MKKGYSEKEKIAWNKALIRAANLVMTYDGIIPNEVERKVISDHIKKLQKKTK